MKKEKLEEMGLELICTKNVQLSLNNKKEWRELTKIMKDAEVRVKHDYENVHTCIENGLLMVYGKEKERHVPDYVRVRLV